jgi:hypothetical protein
MTLPSDGVRVGVFNFWPMIVLRTAYDHCVTELARIFLNGVLARGCIVICEHHFIHRARELWLTRGSIG